MVTYDADDRVTKELYHDLRAARFGIAHTAGHQRHGDEIAIFQMNALLSMWWVGMGVDSGTANWL